MAIKNQRIDKNSIPVPPPPNAEGIVVPKLASSLTGALTPRTNAVIGPPHIPT